MDQPMGRFWNAGKAFSYLRLTSPESVFFLPRHPSSYRYRAYPPLRLIEQGFLSILYAPHQIPIDLGIYRLAYFKDHGKC